MFDCYNTDRLIAWKDFRDTLETSDTPFEDVASFWSRAPFVSPYLNPTNPNSWPDPWHLVLDSKLDELAIILGMLYTIKLTNRFRDTNCEIHSTILLKEKLPLYLLIIDNQQILNLEYRSVVAVNSRPELQTSLLWVGTNFQ